jgi:dTDP-4-dehydrorhamnose 3,5-epimerase
MTLGLHDLRPWSPTAGVSASIVLDAANPRAVIIPQGVAHGFCFLEPTLLVYGASDYYDPEDEIACRFDAPELALSWPVPAPVISQHDRDAPGYDAFRAAFLARWRHVHGAVPDR